MLLTRSDFYAAGRGDVGVAAAGAVSATVMHAQLDLTQRARRFDDELDRLVRVVVRISLA